jgi:hypothetical protein
MYSLNVAKAAVAEQLTQRAIDLADSLIGRLR